MTQTGAVALRTGGWSFLGEDRFGILTAHAPVRRDAMAPPELARDAPVLNIAHPRKVGVLPELRMESGVAVLDRFDRTAGQRFSIRAGLVDGDEPLIGEHRLDHGIASGTDAEL